MACPSHLSTHFCSSARRETRRNDEMGTLLLLWMGAPSLLASQEGRTNQQDTVLHSSFRIVFRHLWPACEEGPSLIKSARCSRRVGRRARCVVKIGWASMVFWGIYCCNKYYFGKYIVQDTRRRGKACSMHSMYFQKPPPINNHSLAYLSSVRDAKRVYRFRRDRSENIRSPSTPTSVDDTHSMHFESHCD